LKWINVLKRDKRLWLQTSSRTYSLHTFHKISNNIFMLLVNMFFQCPKIIMCIYKLFVNPFNSKLPSSTTNLNIHNDISLFIHLSNQGFDVFIWRLIKVQIGLLLHQLQTQCINFCLTLGTSWFFLSSLWEQTCT
jgi:hypothetical protein